MEKTRIIVAIVSVIVTIFVIVYIVTLPKPSLEEPNWITILALLFLYWILFVNWYSKRKEK